MGIIFRKTCISHGWDRTGTPIWGQSEPASIGTKEVIHKPQIFRTEASSSDEI